MHDLWIGEEGRRGGEGVWMYVMKYMYYLTIEHARYGCVWNVGNEK